MKLPFFLRLVPALLLVLACATGHAQTGGSSNTPTKPSDRGALPSTKPSACPNIFTDWYETVPADMVKLADGNCYPRASCAAGWTWNAATNLCVAPSCPANQTWNGTACACPANTSWDGSTCAAQPTCPAGSTWDGKGCAAPLPFFLSAICPWSTAFYSNGELDAAFTTGTIDGRLFPAYWTPPWPFSTFSCAMQWNPYTRVLTMGATRVDNMWYDKNTYQFCAAAQPQVFMWRGFVADSSDPNSVVDLAAASAMATGVPTDVHCQ